VVTAGAGGEAAAWAGAGAAAAAAAGGGSAAAAALREATHHVVRSVERPLDSWWYPTAGVPGWA
jgi:hypothetical protein